MAWLARPAWAQLVRTPRAWIPVAIWAGAGVALAFAGRAEDGAGAADRIAPGPLGGLAVPLLAFATIGGLVGGRSLRETVAPLVAFGATPLRAARSVVTLGVAACAVLCAAVGAASICMAHGPGDPPLVHDALATAWACAWGGAAYGALFACGSSLGRRGAGRALLLVADWIGGRGDGIVAAFTPRAHLRNLLAGPSPLDLGPCASLAAMAALVVVFSAVAIRRAR
jgi:hypothetical protein